MNSKRPTIFIDADACPVIAETLFVARKAGVAVVIVGNTTQNLQRHIKKNDPTQQTKGFWVDVLSVGVGADSADFAIIEELEPYDIVVTQDIGLASMVLGRTAYAISVRGKEFLPATIDMEMELRHVEKKIRRQGGRTKGPAPFTEENREHFLSTLERVVDKAKQAREELL